LRTTTTEFLIAYDELWKQTNEIKIAEQITRRRWNWIGHTLRKDNVIEKETREWKPQGQRKRGRPKRSRQRKVREEALAVGKTCGEIKQLSKNRVPCAPVGAKGRR
jgi:hypothetical protein